jgi:hypothetical protein
MEHPSMPHYHSAPPKGKKIMMESRPTPNNRNNPVKAADIKLMRGADKKTNSKNKTY